MQREGEERKRGRKAVRCVRSLLGMAKSLGNSTNTLAALATEWTA